MTSSTVIADAALPDGRRVDVAVVDGRVATVAAAGAHRSWDLADAEVVDLGGWLLLPAMGEPHAHLDKALTADLVPNPTGDLAGAIASWIANVERITPEGIASRARRALDQLVASGVTAVRSHVNCGEFSGTTPMRIMADIRDEYADLVDLQLVALTSNPMCGPDGRANRDALVAAVEAGADLIGGCPHLEADSQGVIDFTLDVGADAGLPLDLHVDETLDADMLSLRLLARTVLDRGHDLPVTASHCVSLGMQPPEVQHAVAREVSEAGISVVALPQTNLFLQGHDTPTATPRGITAVQPLRAAGAVVTAGADNVQDPFNLVGRSDPLETAALMVMAAHVLPDDAYHLVSDAVRTVLGLEAAGVREGAVADLVAIDATGIREAIADAPAARRVFHRGRLVARVDRTVTIVH